MKGDATIPEIALAHAQALWVLTRLGLRGSGSHLTFHEYIKSVRKFGIPFSPEELAGGRRHTYVYRYEHLMELAVALSLRFHRILPWEVVSVLVSYRSELRSIYRHAYLERSCGLGRPMQLQIAGRAPFEIGGLYLDLNFCYINGRLTSAGPRALGPADVVYAYFREAPRTWRGTPLQISELASEIVKLAGAAPRTRGALKVLIAPT